MSIRARLIFALSVLLGLMGSQVVITISLIARIADISETVVLDNLGRVEYAARLSADLSYLRAGEQALLNVAAGEDFRLRLAQLDAPLRRLATSMEYPENPPEEERRFRQAYQAYLRSHDRLVALAAAGNLPQAVQEFRAAEPLFQAAYGAAEQLRQYEFNQVRSASQMSATLAQQTRRLLTLALVMAALVELSMGWYLARSITTGLNNLLESTRRVAQGDLSHRAGVDSQDEFAQLARSFNAMLRSLEATRQENSRLHAEALRIAEDHVRLLRQHLSQVVQAQEAERQRVARELHDQAGQALTAIQLGLSRLEKLAGNEEWRREAAQLRAMAVSTMEEIRNLAFDLRPSMLDELGLWPALRHYAREFGRRTGLSVEVNLPAAAGRLHSELEITVFRVVQEGLTNIAKHAAATVARVTVELREGSLRLEVQDNGRGFDVAAALQNEKKKSLGLFGMEERVSLVGGTLQINSAPGQGTTLSLVIPLDITGSSLTPARLAAGSPIPQQARSYPAVRS